MFRILDAWRLFAVATLAFSMAFLLVPYASADGVPTAPAPPDPNIITFGNAAKPCSAGALCSTNGTTGYGTSAPFTNPFDLSTISSWFQIGTAAQPLTAGDFLVINDTGAAVTTFSLTLTTAFSSPGTPSVGACHFLETGMECDNFQANKPDGSLGGTSETLSGPDIDSCTNSTSSGPMSCTSTSGQVAANFAPGTVTYTWNGLAIPKGTEFDIQFASWNTSVSAVSAPEPSSLALLATGLFGLVGFVRRRLIF